MKTKIELISRPVGEARADAVVLYMATAGKPPKLGNAAADRAIRGELERRKFKPSLGAAICLALPERGAVRYVVVSGLGAPDAFGPEALLTAVAAGARAAAPLCVPVIATGVPQVAGAAIEPEHGAALTLQAIRGARYRFDRYLSVNAVGADDARFLVSAGTGSAVRQAIRRADRVASGVALARDLVNEPAGALTPSTMAARARSVARAGSLRIKVFGPKELARLKMGALLEVARGSDEPPRVIHLSYTPKTRARRRLALVGKGVTFDSGGYDLKASAHILDMKSDMAGSAAVLGAMQAIAALAPSVEVHGILGMVENLVSGNAFKPGDVLRTRAGKTVEVNNTDAEGRLVLADLLDYACTEIEPHAIVDLATLTGACVIALGPAACGVMTNDRGLGRELMDAAERAGERVWELPLYDDYLEQLKSDIADMKNTGQRYGGALTAGLFLREFVRDGVPWVHMDIAGPAFLDKPHPYWGKGGTGFGVATLVELALGSKR